MGRTVSPLDPSPLPQPSTLLAYLPTYKALICTHPRCQHALAPDSITRHLKEIHKLRRDERKPYLEYVSGFDLAAPEELIQDRSMATQEGNVPIPFLPVLDGFKCEWLETEETNEKTCEHLCASEKRMKMHCSSCHKTTERKWGKVKLQTWYKGNLLKYFAVGKALTEADEKIAGDDESIIILDSEEVALLQHFTISTSLTLATDTPSIELWRSAIPLLAQNCPFLMHGLLAIAALHLAQVHEQPRFAITATVHQSKGLPLFYSAISSPTKENCHAVFVFSHLFTIYASATASHDEKLFIVNSATANGELPAWLCFLRSGCGTLCDVWDYIEVGPVAQLAEAWEVHFTPERIYEAELAAYFDSMATSPPPSQTSWTAEEIGIFREEAAELSCAFSFSKARGTDFNPWDALRAWPMRVHKGLLALLSRWHPGALILLAHYCILLKRVESRWYFSGRAEALLETVLAHLDRGWLDCVRWPMEVVSGKESDFQRVETRGPLLHFDIQV